MQLKRAACTLLGVENMHTHTCIHIRKEFARHTHLRATLLGCEMLAQTSTSSSMLALLRHRDS